MSDHDVNATEDRVGLLHWYIDKYESAYGQSSIPGADQLRRVMSPAARLKAKQVATNAQAQLTRRKAAALVEAAGSVQLHLGCGWNQLEGWINIDLVGGKTDLVWDLRKALPFEPSSVDAVFLEHVFEHMTYSETLTVLGHIRKVLKPGGALRVGVPDAGMYARWYANDAAGLQEFRWGRVTAMLALREVFQEHAHVAAYDAETLVLVLEAGGFPGAKVTEAGTSELLDPAPDMPERWEETVYVEVRSV
jgi:predicted SAM-dependent methyltransferase